MIHIGERYGCYQIVGVRRDEGKTLYIGKCIYCDCLAEKSLSNFKQLKSANCCHYKNGTRILPNRIKDKRLSNIFSEMKSRCYNSANKSYCWYGGQGVRICDEWLLRPETFYDWAINNGYNEALTIDRIDATKDYCPENCRWITQSLNTRRATCASPITATITMSRREWADLMGVGINYIQEICKNNGLEATRSYIEEWSDARWAIK